MQPVTPESRVPPQQPTPAQPTTPLGYQVMVSGEHTNHCVYVLLITIEDFVQYFVCFPTPEYVIHNAFL